MKICNICGEEKDEEEFYTRFYKKTGHTWVSKTCKRCERKQQNEYNKTYKRKAPRRITYKLTKNNKSLDEYTKWAHDLHISYGTLVMLVEGKRYNEIKNLSV